MWVSPLGLGTVKLSRDKGVKYPAGFKIPSDRKALNLIALAKDLGINLIDTAPVYGNSEEVDPATGDSSYNFSPEHPL